MGRKITIRNDTQNGKTSRIFLGEDDITIMVSKVELVIDANEANRVVLHLVPEFVDAECLVGTDRISFMPSGKNYGEAAKESFDADKEVADILRRSKHGKTG